MGFLNKLVMFYHYKNVNKAYFLNSNRNFRKYSPSFGGKKNKIQDRSSGDDTSGSSSSDDENNKTNRRVQIRQPIGNRFIELNSVNRKSEYLKSHKPSLTAVTDEKINKKQIVNKVPKLLNDQQKPQKIFEESDEILNLTKLLAVNEPDKVNNAKLDAKNAELLDAQRKAAEDVARFLSSQSESQEKIVKEILEQVDHVKENKKFQAQDAELNAVQINDLVSEINVDLDSFKIQQDLTEKSFEKQTPIVKHRKIQLRARDRKMDEKSIKDSFEISNEFSNDGLREVKIYRTTFNNPYNLFEWEPLNIFTSNDFEPLKEQPQESLIWQQYRKDRFEDLASLPPLNGFEEAIQLTKEGKLWHFPIDNEQGIDNDDTKMPFYEHVLLDVHLKEFPKVDVIQNFMKLILNGLSKNAFLSVKEKKEMIFWYRDYFNSKLNIIEEALRIEKQNQ